MKTPLRRSRWLTSAPPRVAVEIASHRVTVVGLTASATGTDVSAHASEPLPEGTVVPGLSAPNIATPAVVTDALARALDRAGLGSTRRVALVVPDSAARVALLNFEQLPARQDDLDQLIRWQLRKTMPFPIDGAQVSYVMANEQDGGVTICAVVARREVISEYENVCASVGVHAGIVDLASLNVMNAIVGAGAAPAGDWLLVHLAAEATTLAILRHGALMFYRHRTAVDEEPLGALVHQTAMYHEDRLGGGAFERVWLCGAGRGIEDVGTEVASRLGVRADLVDVRAAAGLGDRVGASPELLDALAAPVGILIREQRAA